MIRIVFFLVLVGLAAAGAAWVAEQTGNVVLTWGPWKAEMGLPVFVLLLGIAIVAIMLLWSIVSALLRAPGRIRRHHHARRHARGRHAITHGLLAIGHGDPTAARRHADVARRLAGDDPLTLLLHAQAAQLEGDPEAARRAFRVMAERQDTRLLGLRGLFIEAQRSDDAIAAVMIADEALKVAPQATWASQAVLGFRCAQGDWNGALAILDSNYTAGLVDKPTYRRQRGVLLTARAIELESKNRDLSRTSVMEAVKLAPTLVPAAVLAAKFESEAHQVRRAMKIIEAAWIAQPHPELAEAYAHVRLGDSARQRLSRVENLAGRTPGQIEGALAIARAAIDAAEFKRARDALAPFIADPTQRVAMLMAELERTEHGDAGKAREWTLRAVRARHDPAWTADGYVSHRWHPVSPVTGRLDAFQWQTPVASLPSERGAAIEPQPFDEAMLPVPERPTIAQGLAEPPREVASEPAVIEPTPQDNLPASTPVDEAVDKPADKPVERVEDKSAAAPGPAVPAAAPAEAPEPAPPLQAAAPEDASGGPSPSAATRNSAPAGRAAPAASAPASSAPLGPTPLYRTRSDLGKPAEAPIPAIVPIIRPPDDPGIEEDEAARDEFAEQIAPKQQAGGWRGFLSRFGG
ncbi:heme biosynthesis protein HemY [Bradyrhizobium sp. SZCCHNR3058]|uniref:heme biosynthesis protein HemY n=1 Tax=Bradyrhizobium sp. SZCCHNR3058 TaxID=3057423 RepID=UPI002916412C|nr:heme biosynthesis HemY N-terminal domain-containing protein [Bradyrhizobium sp. SZCCHNR3058]